MRSTEEAKRTAETDVAILEGKDVFVAFHRALRAQILMGRMLIQEDAALVAIAIGMNWLMADLGVARAVEHFRSMGDKLAAMTPEERQAERGDAP